MIYYIIVLFIFTSIVLWILPITILLSYDFIGRLSYNIFTFIPYTLYFAPVFVYSLFDEYYTFITLGLVFLLDLLYGLFLSIYSLFRYRKIEANDKIDLFISIATIFIALLIIILATLSNDFRTFNFLMPGNFSNIWLGIFFILFMLGISGFLIFTLLKKIFMSLVNLIIEVINTVVKKSKKIDIGRAISKMSNFWIIRKLKFKNPYQIYLYFSLIMVIVGLIYLSSYSFPIDSETNDSLVSDLYRERYYSTLSVWQLIIASFYIPLIINSPKWIKKKKLPAKHKSIKTSLYIPWYFE